MQDAENADAERSSRRRIGWTPARRASFLTVLEDCGDVSVASLACRLSRQSAYKLRRRDPLFARDWDAALERLQNREGAEMAAIVAELRRRADERENSPERSPAKFPRTPSTYQPCVNQPASC